MKRSLPKRAGCWGRDYDQLSMRSLDPKSVSWGLRFDPLCECKKYSRDQQILLNDMARRAHIVRRKIFFLSYIKEKDIKDPKITKHICSDRRNP